MTEPKYSNVFAIRKFLGELPEISEDITYVSDDTLVDTFLKTYEIWKKDEDALGIYITKRGGAFKVVKLGEMTVYDRCPFRSEKLIEKARKTLTNLRFEEMTRTYEDVLASTKSEKKKKALVKPTFAEAQRWTFNLMDYDIFQLLEFNDYFVFEQKESLTDYGEEGREVLLKVSEDG